MIKDPFLKALEELLEDQIDHIDFKKIDRTYVELEYRKEATIKTLRTLPETVETEAGAINVHELLRKLDDFYFDFAVVSFDVGIKHGFSLAFKLILHLGGY